MNHPRITTPLITTIIPTYRRPERLKRAIQSVLDQTYPHFQVCVYDNASGDSTAAVVAAFTGDTRVKYHCHSQNIGSIGNFQYGMSRVNTPFFSFLSDDDFLLPEFYETTLQGLEKFPEAAFSMGAVIDSDDCGKVIDVALLKWPDQHYFSPPNGLLEMIGKYSNWTGVLFRREVIEKIGPLDFRLEAIDVDYLLRAAAQLPFVISKAPCAVFVQHSTSYSKCNALKIIWPGWPTMMAKIRENPQLFPAEKQIAEQMLQRDGVKRLVIYALQSIRQKRLSDAQCAIDIMQEQCGAPIKTLLLAILIKGAKIFPFIPRWVPFLLYVIPRLLRIGIMSKIFSYGEKRVLHQFTNLKRMQSEYAKWLNR